MYYCYIVLLYTAVLTALIYYVPYLYIYHGIPFTPPQSIHPSIHPSIGNTTERTHASGRRRRCRKCVSDKAYILFNSTYTLVTPRGRTVVVRGHASSAGRASSAVSNTTPRFPHTPRKPTAWTNLGACDMFNL